jgi:hypothetical protein
LSGGGRPFLSPGSQPGLSVWLHESGASDQRQLEYEELTFEPIAGNDFSRSFDL